MAFPSRWPQIRRCTDLAGKSRLPARAGRAKVPGPLPRWCLMLARMLWPDEIWPQEIGALAVLDGGLAGLAAEAVRFSLRPARLPQASRLPPGTMAGRPILTCRSRASATLPRD